jgi:GntR family transcriptional regulator
MNRQPSACSAADLRARLQRIARPGVPKYVALRDAIVEAVAEAELPAGARLPTESEWVSGLQLSLGTVQRALRLLVEDGLITRKHGTGSFVAERGIGRMHAPLHCRFLNDSGTAYLPVYPQVIERYTIDTPGPWSRHLGTNQVICIARVLRIGNDFKIYSRFYADPVRLPAFATLPARKLSGENFKEIIWRDTHHPIGRLAQYLSACKLPSKVCDAIGVRRGSRGQLLEVSAFVGHRSPVYYQELFIPPNRRRLHLAGDGKDPGLPDTDVLR